MAIHAAMSVPPVGSAPWNHTALFLGCSLDRYALQWFCSGPDRNIEEAFGHHQWCKDTKLNLSIAAAFHPGVGFHGDMNGPFFSRWKPSYSTRHVIERVAPEVVQHALKRDPDIVFVDSSLWDLAAWNENSSEWVSLKRVQKWCDHDLPNLLATVRAVFGRSRIIFRTAPPIRNDVRRKFSNEGIDAMYNCVVKHKYNGHIFGQYQVLDYRMIMKDLLAKTADNTSLYIDAWHPSQRPALLYMKEAMSLLGLDIDATVRESLTRSSLVGLDEMDI